MKDASLSSEEEDEPENDDQKKEKSDEQPEITVNGVSEKLDNTLPVTENNTSEGTPSKKDEGDKEEKTNGDIVNGVLSSSPNDKDAKSKESNDEKEEKSQENAMDITEDKKITEITDNGDKSEGVEQKIDEKSEKTPTKDSKNTPSKDSPVNSQLESNNDDALGTSKSPEDEKQDDKNTLDKTTKASIDEKCIDDTNKVVEDISNDKPAKDDVTPPNDEKGVAENANDDGDVVMATS